MVGGGVGGGTAEAGSAALAPSDGAAEVVGLCPITDGGAPCTYYQFPRSTLPGMATLLAQCMLPGRPAANQVTAPALIRLPSPCQSPALLEIMPRYWSLQ